MCACLLPFSDLVESRTLNIPYVNMSAFSHWSMDRSERLLLLYHTHTQAGTSERINIFQALSLHYSLGNDLDEGDPSK